MTKEISQVPEMDQLPSYLNNLFKQWDLPVLCTSSLTKKGHPMLIFSSSRGSTSIDAGTILSALQKGRTSILFRLAADCFPGIGANADTLDLLTREEFAASCLTQIDQLPQKGNEALNRLVGAPANSIPVLYDSTSGLNLAEVFETIICTKTAIDLGLPAYALFGTTGHENARARKMLDDSIKAIPNTMISEFEQFAQRLGPTWADKRTQAAQQLIGEFPVNFITAESTFAAVRQEFTLAKLILLSHLATGQPLLFEGSWRQFKPPDLINKPSPTLLGTPVASFMDTENAAASGFTWYARDAVLGADVPGSFIVPCKLTTHANIYKILGSYGSLYSQKEEGGVILCPITRHRIQTADQAATGSNPCDVTVIAYLAQKFPDAFGQLLSDFAASCRVLDPQQALTAGTGDKKFIVENYFPI